MAKYKKDVKKSDVNAIIRRMDLDGDGKITFREFAHGITPEYPGVSQSVTTSTGGAKLALSSRKTPVPMDFNIERKQEIKRQHEEDKQNTIKKRNGSLSPLRDYRPIYNAPTHYAQGSITGISPVKGEFQSLKLRQECEPENQYIVDLIKVGSPIGKLLRSDQEPNVRSPIRPYGDASFLSMRD